MHYPTLGDELDKSIYVIKYDDNSFAEMHKSYCLDNKITIKRFSQSPEINAFLAEHPDYTKKNINEICMAAGGISLLKRIVCLDHTRQERSSRMEAMLNKHSGIYPTLLPLEDAEQ